MLDAREPQIEAIESRWASPSKQNGLSSWQRMFSMAETSEYLLEPLREGANFTLYRGTDRHNQMPILAVRSLLHSRHLRGFAGSNTNTR